jgi:hypothetical protein
MFLGGRISAGAALEDQAVAESLCEGFLGSLAHARCAVPLPMPNPLEIAAQDRPWARREATLEASTTIRGLPELPATASGQRQP